MPIRFNLRCLWLLLVYASFSIARVLQPCLPDRANGHDRHGGPPIRAAAPSGTDALFILPKASITAVRGRIGNTREAQQPQRSFGLNGESPQFWDLIGRDAKLEKVATDFGFTEGPVWDSKGFLYVSDEEQNYIFRVFLDGRREKVIALGDPDGDT